MLEVVDDTVYGRCSTCHGPITYRAIMGPKMDGSGNMFMGQISEGLWCMYCKEPQPWGTQWEHFEDYESKEKS